MSTKAKRKTETTLVNDVEALVIACLALLDREDLTDEQRFKVDGIYGDASEFEESLRSE